MNKSESLKNLATALAKFQEEVKNPANTANNPFFKSKYAPLSDVLNLVRPILTKHGLSLIQSPSGNGTDIIVSTLLLHSSGEWIETEPLILKADKATAQGCGSAITYGRRYAISAVLGISSEDDDDGNHATGNKEVREEPKAKKVYDTPPTGDDLISESQRKRLFALSKGQDQVAKAVLEKFGYKSSKDIRKEHYTDICDLITAEVGH